MMTPRDKLIAEISRAQGVITALYGVVRDMNIGSLVDKDENGKLGDVISDTLNGLNSIVDLWDDAPAKHEDSDNE